MRANADVPPVLIAFKIWTVRRSSVGARAQQSDPVKRMITVLVESGKSPVYFISTRPLNFVPAAFYTLLIIVQIATTVTNNFANFIFLDMVRAELMCVRIRTDVNSLRRPHRPWGSWYVPITQGFTILTHRSIVLVHHYPCEFRSCYRRHERHWFQPVSQPQQWHAGTAWCLRATVQTRWQ